MLKPIKDYVKDFWVLIKRRSLTAFGAIGMTLTLVPEYQSQIQGALEQLPVPSWTRPLLQLGCVCLIIHGRVRLARGQRVP